MDQRSVIGRINASVLALGVLFSLGTLLAFGVDAALGALIGAIVGFANWRLLKFIIERVTGAKGKQGQPAFLMILVLKMGALLGLSWLLMARFDVHAGGFAIGIGALVVGMLVGTLASDHAAEDAGLAELRESDPAGGEG